MVLHRPMYVCTECKASPGRVGEHLQRRRMSNFMESSKAAAEAKNTAPTKMLVLGLNNKYHVAPRIQTITCFLLVRRNIPNIRALMGLTKKISMKG